MKTLKQIFNEISTVEEILTFELHDDIVQAHEMQDYPQEPDFVATLLNDENGY